MFKNKPVILQILYAILIVIFVFGGYFTYNGVVRAIMPAGDQYYSEISSMTEAQYLEKYCGVKSSDDPATLCKQNFKDEQKRAQEYLDKQTPLALKTSVNGLLTSLLAIGLLKYFNIKGKKMFVDKSIILQILNLVLILMVVGGCIATINTGSNLVVRDVWMTQTAALSSFLFALGWIIVPTMVLIVMAMIQKEPTT